MFLLDYREKKFVDKLLMMNLGILNREVDTHRSPDQVTIDNLMQNMILLN